jgi:hypothetical protein
MIDKNVFDISNSEQATFNRRHQNREHFQQHNLQVRNIGCSARPRVMQPQLAVCSKRERMRCASRDTRHFKFEISGKTDTSKESKRLKIGFRIIDSEMW